MNLFQSLCFTGDEGHALGHKQDEAIGEGIFLSGQEDEHAQCHQSGPQMIKPAVCPLSLLHSIFAESVSEQW